MTLQFAHLFWRESLEGPENHADYRIRRRWDLCWGCGHRDVRNLETMKLLKNKTNKRKNKPNQSGTGGSDWGRQAVSDSARAGHMSPLLPLSCDSAVFKLSHGPPSPCCQTETVQQGGGLQTDPDIHLRWPHFLRMECGLGD